MSYKNPQIFRRTIAKSVVDSATVTGTTAETIVDNILIPGGTFQVKDIIDLTVRMRKTGVAGTGTLKIYLNTTSGTTAGATQVSISQITTITGLYNQNHRYIAIKSATNSEVLNSGVINNIDWPIAAITSAVSAMNINWAVDQYFIITLTNGNAADSTIRSFYLIQK